MKNIQEKLKINSSIKVEIHSNNFIVKNENDSEEFSFDTEEEVIFHLDSLSNSYKEEKVKRQIELQNKIQSAGYNIVNCCDCGSIVLHECNEEDLIDYPYCDKIVAKHDCPDYLYEGLELNYSK